MKNWMKLAIAAVVGVVAAVLNNMALQSKLTPKEYVRISPAVTRIKAGEPLRDGDLQKLLLPAGDTDDLARTAVPWKDKAALVGIPAARELKGGSILFWRDASPAAETLLEPGEAAVQVSIGGVRYPPGLLAIGRKVIFLVRKDARLAADQKKAGSAPGVVQNVGVVQYEHLGPFRIIGLGDRLLNPSNKGDQNAVGGSGDSVVLAMKMKEDGQMDPQTLQLIASARAGGTYGSLDAVVVLQGDK